MYRPDHLADRPRDRRLVVHQRACREGFTVVVAERDHDVAVLRVARVDQYGDTDEECDRQDPNPEPPGVPRFARAGPIPTPPTPRTVPVVV
jgi:hypothetical protein